MKKKVTDTSILNKNSSVLFATFIFFVKGKPIHANGMIEPIRTFFTPRVKKFSLLIQPHPGSNRIEPFVEIYSGKLPTKKKKISPFYSLPLYFLCKLQNTDDTHISFKIRDFLSVLYVGITAKKKYDIFIGLECINAIAGILLRKLGRVERVIYYVSDFAPKRYGNKIFNGIYNWLDAFCIQHADSTWDVSPAMKESRLKEGIIKNDTKKIIHVPNGLFKSQINPIPVAKRAPNSIVYMGLLNPNQQGVDLALHAFKKVLKKIPDSTFHIVGGATKDGDTFVKLVKKLGLEKSVIFHGFIPPNKKMSDIINKCMVGIATYRSDGNPRNRYGDSGKIRQYLGCGLPIVATTIQWYTRDAIKKGAGIGVKENPDDFAKAILKLFENKTFYQQCSKKALELSKNNTWENTYRDAFQKMEQLTEE